MLTPEAASLVAELNAQNRPGLLAELRKGCTCRRGRIAFVGRASGEHTLCVAASDRARVLAHWAGYAGLEPPVETISASEATGAELVGCAA